MSVAEDFAAYRKVVGEHIEKLERENAALRELTSTLGAPNHINIPVEKWRELRADKERLDWLLTDNGGFWVNWMYEKDEWTPELKASRDGIDAAKRRGHE